MSARRTGIEVRHRGRCPGDPCRCRPAYRAWIYSAAEGRRIRRTFPTYAAARDWRANAWGDVKRGRLRADRGPTVREAAEAWLAGAEDGTIRNRSGDRYKPSTLRGYREALRLRILPDLGGSRLREVSTADLQRFTDRLTGDPSTIRNTLLPLRAIYRHALARGDVTTNPTTALQLPALLAALPARDRALWATALYGGLRRGELRALRWGDVDLDRGVIRVERSWDVKDGAIEPKSRAGRRTVPVPAALGDHLRAHRDAAGSVSPDALMFGRTPEHPFDPSTVTARARRAWKGAKLAPIGLHESRHTFASLMIAAGANAKALSTYLGHSSIAITMDRYGHLMPGNEAEAADMLDRYLQRGAVMGQSDPASSGLRRSQAGNGTAPERALEGAQPRS